MKPDRPFHLKDFIRHLPDLLGAGESGMESSAAREAIARDPQTRLMVSMIGDAVRTMTGPTERRGIAIPRRWQGSLETARRVYGGRLGAMLYNTAIAGMAEANRDTMYYEGVSGAGVRRFSAAELLEAEAEVRDALEIPAQSEQVGWVRRAVARLGSASAVSDADALLEGASALLPDHPSVACWNTELSQCVTGVLSLHRWQELASRTHDVNVRACAYGWMGLILINQQRPTAALESLQLADVLAPGSWCMAQNGLIAALLAGERSWSAHFADRLTRAWTAVGSHESVRVVLRTGHALKEVPIRSPGLLEEVMSLVPEDLRDLMLEVIR